MRVAIMGSGGVGAYVGGRLQAAAEDLAHGKPLELRWLSGRVHGLGLQYGVPTPAHSTMYRALVLYEHGKPDSDSITRYASSDQ